MFMTAEHSEQFTIVVCFEDHSRTGNKRESQTEDNTKIFINTRAFPPYIKQRYLKI